MQSIKLYPLHLGKFAQVDDEDFALLSLMKWWASKDGKSGLWYAATHWSEGGKQKATSMHRIVLGLHVGDSREGDHIETSDTLNNQRSNLRISTRQQNNCNRRIRKDNTSGVKGVSYAKRYPERPWLVQIMVNKKAMNLGRYLTKDEGAIVYAEAAKRLHGEFARLA